MNGLLRNQISCARKKNSWIFVYPLSTPKIYSSRRSNECGLVVKWGSLKFMRYKYIRFDSLYLYSIYKLIQFFIYTAGPPYGHRRAWGYRRNIRMPAAGE